MKLAKRLLLSLAAAIGLFLIATTILITAGLQDEIGHADVALVLGNTVAPDGTPSPRLQARLDRTLELYRAGYFPDVIASGGLGQEGRDEARVMRDYLVARGIPESHVIVDSGGITTFASAQNARRIADQRKLKSIFVISQYFHVPRLRLALKRFGFSTVYYAHAPYFEWRDVYSVPRELVGYLSYFLRRYPAETPRAG